MKKLSAKTRELRLKFVLKLVCFYLILITSKSLMAMLNTSHASNNKEL